MRGRPAPGRRPPRALALLAAGATALAVLVVVTARVLAGQAGLGASDLDERLRAQQLEVARIEMEIAKLRSPSRIFDRATQLGLVLPDHVVYLTPSAPPSGASSSPSKAPSPSSPSPGRGGR